MKRINWKNHFYSSTRSFISLFISFFVRTTTNKTTNSSNFYQHPFREDYYQEILIRLWKAYPKFKRESAVSTWLYRVALNAAIDLVRKESIQPVYKELSAQEYSIHDSHSADNSMTDKKEQLYQAINQLSDIEKAIIILYLEGNEYKEISAVIGISETNVGVRINRIKKQLIKLLKDGRV